MTTKAKRLEFLKADLLTKEEAFKTLKKVSSKTELERLRKEWIEPVEKEIEELMKGRMKKDTKKK